MDKAISMFLAWTVVQARQVSRIIKQKILTILTTHTALIFTLSVLAYLLLSKVATLTQSNPLIAIFLHVHFCFTTGPEH